MKLLHRDIARGAAWARQRGLTYLANAHRLDFETSGVILLAKDKAALVALADQFGAEKPAKTYVALVQGSPGGNSFAVEARLAPHPTRATRASLSRSWSARPFEKKRTWREYRSFMRSRLSPRLSF